MKKQKQLLINNLQNYTPHTNTELEHKNNILKFLNEKDNNFDRSNLEGHITGSAFLLNKDKTKILLHHHRKLDKWLQFGGHADGSPNILSVAIREAQEESGIQNITPVKESIFDVDVHIIPEKTTKGEPKHFHYDIRYLLWTPSEKFNISSESIDLKWIHINEIEDFINTEAFMRMINKWKNI